METNPKTCLIFNGASGSHDDAAIDELVARLTHAGYRPERLIDAKDGTPDAAAANAAGLGLLVVHGGDGTLSRTIGDLEGFTGAVLPLPGGTYNLLCKDIFGDRTPLEIVELLASGQLAPHRRTCIRGEGQLALCELLAGPGAKWADVREEMREANVGEVISKGVEAATDSTTGPMVSLTSPAGGRDTGYAGVRLTPKADGMLVEGYATDGVGEILQAGFAILKRDFREGPHDELGLVRDAAMHSQDHAAIPLMVDGERSEGGGSLAFALDTLGVDVLGLADAR